MLLKHEHVEWNDEMMVELIVEMMVGILLTKFYKSLLFIS